MESSPTLYSSNKDDYLTGPRPPHYDFIYLQLLPLEAPFSNTATAGTATSAQELGQGTQTLLSLLFPPEGSSTQDCIALDCP